MALARVLCFEDQLSTGTWGYPALTTFAITVLVLTPAEEAWKHVKVLIYLFFCMYVGFWALSMCCCPHAWVQVVEWVSSTEHSCCSSQWRYPNLCSLADI